MDVSLLLVDKFYRLIPFTNLGHTDVAGGMGMALLQKLGWRPGKGLGKNKEGTVESLQLEIKLDKKSLISHQGKKLKLPTMSLLVCIFFLVFINVNRCLYLPKN